MYLGMNTNHRAARETEPGPPIPIPPDPRPDPAEPVPPLPEPLPEPDPEPDLAASLLRLAELPRSAVDRIAARSSASIGGGIVRMRRPTTS
jgi:hypothetical protein